MEQPKDSFVSQYWISVLYDMVQSPSSFQSLEMVSNWVQQELWVGWWVCFGLNRIVLLDLFFSYGFLSFVFFQVFDSSKDSPSFGRPVLWASSLGYHFVAECSFFFASFIPTYVILGQSLARFVISNHLVWCNSFVIWLVMIGLSSYAILLQVISEVEQFCVFYAMLKATLRC